MCTITCPHCNEEITITPITHTPTPTITVTAIWSEGDQTEHPWNLIRGLTSKTSDGRIEKPLVLICKTDLGTIKDVPLREHIKKMFRKANVLIPVSN